MIDYMNDYKLLCICLWWPKMHHTQ